MKNPMQLAIPSLSTFLKGRCHNSDRPVRSVTTLQAEGVL